MLRLIEQALYQPMLMPCLTSDSIRWGSGKYSSFPFIVIPSLQYFFSFHCHSRSAIFLFFSLSVHISHIFFKLYILKLSPLAGCSSENRLLFFMFALTCYIFACWPDISDFIKLAQSYILQYGEDQHNPSFKCVQAANRSKDCRGMSSITLLFSMKIYFSSPNIIL